MPPQRSAFGAPGDASLEESPVLAPPDEWLSAASSGATHSPDKQELLHVDLAGKPISGASRRLRALAALSGSLTDSLDPQDAANLVEQQALSALGATSAVVVTLGPFPPTESPGVGTYAPPTSETLHLVHAIGLPDELAATLQQLPLDAPVPLAEVARVGEPLFLPSENSLRRYAEWGAAMIAAGSRSAAIVPVWANGELRGVLGLAWPDARVFDEDERAFVLTLGVMCAQAIMRAHLRAAELESRQAEHLARETAERANQSKAHFIAMISHELRTPINAVIGYTELLTEEISGPVSTLQRDNLGRMRASGTHLLGLIEDLLGYARIEAGKEVVRPESVALADIVEQSLVLVRPIAERKGLRIRVEAPPDEVLLHTDPRKLRQVLVNLLANAVKYTVNGEVVLLLRIEGHDAEVRVFFEVTDAGPGIAAEDHEHIFELFWQKDPTAKHGAGSSGLGLSVARQLARLLGGDVVVGRSVLAEGSTFVVSLPARYSGPIEA
jgi:signal transduction histidine kinase